MDIPLNDFWICIELVDTRISKVAIETLRRSCATHLCEQSFSFLLLTINIICLNYVDEELRAALSIISLTYSDCTH